MIRDAPENVGQVGLGIEAVIFAVAVIV